MKILFAGTPDIAVPSLNALAEHFNMAGVLTAPDKVSGRGRKVTAPPVKTAAEELGLPVFQPARLGREERETITSLGADLLVVFAYGRIFGPKFLAIFPRGGINMHPSALPKFRGPAPISAAILAGDSETALTVQRIALEMDSGDILRQTVYPLNGGETTGSLTESIARDAAVELTETVKGLETGSLAAFPQNHTEATYCHLVKKDDGLVDWVLSAEQIERMVRAFNPWPKARTTLESDTLAILESAVVPSGEIPDETVSTPGTVLGVDKSRGILIQTGNGILAVTRLQLASRKPLDHRAFLNGVKLESGTILGRVHES